MKESTPRPGTTHRGGNRTPDKQSDTQKKPTRPHGRGDVKGGGEMPQSPGRRNREDDDQQFRPQRHDASETPIEPEQEPEA